MARYQYRVAGEFDWFSNSGNALMAIYNPPGSGKKLTLGTFELTNLSTTNAATVPAALPTTLSLSRATVADGDSVPLSPMDSDASAWPATVRVTRGATVASPSILAKVAVAKQLTATNTAWASMHRPHGLGRIQRAPRATATAVEGIVVRAAESIALYVDTLSNSLPLKITATMVRSGSPNRTWTTSYFTNALVPNQAVFAVENQSGSGEVITLRSLSVEEIGSFDTPYFQLVPVGSIFAEGLGDEGKVVTGQTLKMDSAYPDADTLFRVMKNVCILPYGLPENALADSSSGSPKGMNYLKTKDFLGPVFRTVLPEQVVRTSTGGSDYLGFHNQHRAADILVRRAGITIREGEAVALVSAAETAAGATAAVGLSGWMSLHFAAQVTVEPSSTPTLRLTGLKNPTEVRVFDGGTTTAVAGQEDVTTGTFEWVYDPDEYSSVDIAVLSLGYQNLRLTSVALGTSDVTIPVQQQLDRQYQNP